MEDDGPVGRVLQPAPPPPPHLRPPKFSSVRPAMATASNKSEEDLEPDPSFLSVEDGAGEPAPPLPLRPPKLSSVRGPNHERSGGLRYPSTKPTPRSVSSSSTATKIQSVEASLRGMVWRDFPLNIVKPLTVAIGPYHHFHLLQQEKMDEAKQVALEEFYGAVEQPREAVREKMISVAASARGCYTNLSYSFDKRSGEDEGMDKFAKMMLLDGCFLLQFMVSMCPGDDPKLKSQLMSIVEVHTHMDAIARDMMLLENQIPWPVLKALMEFRPALDKTVDRFLDLMASIFDVGNERGNNSTDLQQRSSAILESEAGQGQLRGGAGLAAANYHGRQEDQQQPDHLLALFWRRQVGPPRTGDHNTPRLSSVSTTAVELAEMGVKLTASKAKEFGDMSVTKRQWRGLGFGLYGELSLAPLVLNEVTACWLINMAAYEACLGASQADNFAVSSYFCIVGLLMNREEDVQELRAKGIVNSTFSNQTTLAFFKWAAQGLRVGHRYYQVFQSLEEYKQERWAWIAVHRFIYNNIKAIATILSIAGVLAGLFKTILSIKQPRQ